MTINPLTQTAAGQIALNLDKLDRVSDGIITKSVWEDFWAKHGGNEFKGKKEPEVTDDGISVQDAMKYIMTRIFNAARKNHKNVNKLGVEWFNSIEGHERIRVVPTIDTSKKTEIKVQDETSVKKEEVEEVKEETKKEEIKIEKTQTEVTEPEEVKTEETKSEKEQTAEAINSGKEIANNIESKLQGSIIEELQKITKDNVAVICVRINSNTQLDLKTILKLKDISQSDIFNYIVKPLQEKAEELGIQNETPCDENSNDNRIYGTIKKLSKEIYKKQIEIVNK